MLLDRRKRLLFRQTFIVYTSILYLEPIQINVYIQYCTKENKEYIFLTLN